MATQVTKKVIIVDVKGSKQAIADLKALQKHAASTDRNVARMGKTLGNLGFTVKAFIAYRLTAYMARLPSAFIDTADSISLMESRLALANSELDNTAVLMDELFDIAERSRGSIEAVSTLYTRLAVSSKALGASQQEVLDFTELVSDTFILSGASAAEAASGITQISQAMSKGKLDGDEFKSISENNVYFMELLGKATEKTRGELLEMSKTGKITGQVLLGMGNSVDEVRGQVGDMPVTFDQMAVAWGNAVTRMLSDSDTVLGYMQQRFRILRDLANDISTFFDDSKAAEIRKFEDALTNLIERRAKLRQQKNEPKSFLSGIFNEDIKIQNQLDVINNSIDGTLERIRKLKEELDRDKPAGISTDKGDFTPPPVESPFTKWVDGLKKADAELSLFYPKLEKLDELFFNDQISESIYNKELEKLTGNLSEASSGMSELQEAEQQLKDASESVRTPLESLGFELSEIGNIAKEFPQLADRVSELQEKMLKGFSPSKQKDEWIDWGKTAETAVKGVTGAFIDMAISGKNTFADFAESFLINIAKMIAQAAVLKALQGAAGSGGFLGLFPTKAANGAVFDQGKIIPMASGGLITRPTLFPMADGGAVLGGEAGIEAVMPLTRMANGKLGVEASGGGATVVNINNYTNATATVSESTNSAGGKTIDVMIKEQVNAALQGGGLDKNMAKIYGNRRVGY